MTTFSKLEGQMQALSVLHQEICKVCAVEDCTKCLYLKKALETEGRFDCRMLAYMEEHRVEVRKMKEEAEERDREKIIDALQVEEEMEEDEQG